MDEDLRPYLKHLSLITDAAPVYLSHCDRERRFKFVNKSNAERFGLKPEDFVGKYVWEIMGREAYETIRSYVDRVLSGESLQFEAEVPYQGIGTRYMYCSYAPKWTRMVRFLAGLEQ